MKIKRPILLAAVITVFIASCNSRTDAFDASGSFEAEETIISSEATGVLKSFDIEEGHTLNAGQVIGYIDSTQLYYKKQQLQALIGAAASRRPDIAAQLSALESQLKKAETEHTRITNLVRDGAAPKKQLDDINAEIELLQSRIVAQRSVLFNSTEGISKDVLSIEAQLAQLNDQLSKCRIINPLHGTVLSKYAMQNEMAMNGKPLYKIADLSNIYLKAYITADQLQKVEPGKVIRVLTDDGSEGYKETEGVITWISDKAEFTPKTIQTRDERANLVYAIKVKVVNDGSYKIGMYGEIRLDNSKSE